MPAEPSPKSQLWVFPQGLCALSSVLLGIFFLSCFLTPLSCICASPRVPLAFLHSFSNLLCSIVLGKMATKLGRLLFGWKNSAGSLYSCHFLSCRRCFFCFSVGNIIALYHYTVMLSNSLSLWFTF